jgi:hypothetical protein
VLCLSPPCLVVFVCLCFRIRRCFRSCDHLIVCLFAWLFVCVFVLDVFGTCFLYYICMRLFVCCCLSCCLWLFVGVVDVVVFDVVR